MLLENGIYQELAYTITYVSVYNKNRSITNFDELPLRGLRAEMNSKVIASKVHSNAETTLPVACQFTY